MAICPHLALLLALPFLFKRHCVWWWFLLCASLLVIFNLAYAGVGGVEGFLRVLIVSGRGVNYQTSEEIRLTSSARYCTRSQICL